MKIKALISLFLLILLGIFIYKEFYSLKEEPKLSYEIFKEGEKSGTLYFKHVVHNVGDKNVRVKFLSDVEVDYTVSEVEGNGKREDSNSPINNSNKNKDGRTISLGSGEKLENDILIKVDDLPKGRYRLLAKLAAENIQTPSLTVFFNIE